MMGTGGFALPTLEALYESAHSLVGLYTQPDRTGRGHHRHVNPLKELALKYGTPVFQPANVNAPDALDELRGLNADLCVVAAYGQLLSAEMLAIPRYGAVNLHASLLPRHRGATPVHYAILAGDAETGVTIFQIDPRLDAGEMLGVVTTAIGPKETTGELEARLASVAAPLACTVVDQIEAGTVERTRQDPALVTKAPRFKKEFGAIDWSRPAIEIERHVRAMQPWPKAYTWLHQPGAKAKRLIVLEADACETAREGTVGQIVVAEGDELVVQTGQGGLRLRRIRPEGKGDMTAADFLRGHRVTTECRLAGETA